MAEFSPHNSAINSRFQSEFWPIFEHYAIKAQLIQVFSAYAEVVPAGPRGPRRPLCILRARGGSSTVDATLIDGRMYSPRTRR